MMHGHRDYVPLGTLTLLLALATCGTRVNALDLESNLNSTTGSGLTFTLPRVKNTGYRPSRRAAVYGQNLLGNSRFP